MHFECRRNDAAVDTTLNDVVAKLDSQIAAVEDRISSAELRMCDDEDCGCRSGDVFVHGDEEFEDSLERTEAFMLEHTTSEQREEYLRYG